MNITEVRVKLMRNRSDRLRAFCSITIDGDFVVHDLRVIEGRKGLFVAMPSRKLTDNCPRCGGKNELRSKYCNECGAALSQDRADKAAEKSHVDVAHPINTPCRELLQATVLTAYGEEVGRVSDETSDGEGESLSEFDDSPDEPVDETESQWVEAEVREPELLLGNVSDDDPPEPTPEPEVVAEEAGELLAGFADSSGEATEEAPEEDLPSEDEGESEEAAPVEGEQTKHRSRARAKRETGAFGEGIL